MPETNENPFESNDESFPFNVEVDSSEDASNPFTETPDTQTKVVDSSTEMPDTFIETPDTQTEITETSAEVNDPFTEMPGDSTENAETSAEETIFEPQKKAIVSEIANITPAKFDIFLKLLSNLTETNDTIIIKNNTIIKSMGSAIAKTDLNKIFDKKPVSFEIINPKKYVGLMKQFKNNNNIVIINDEPNSRYIIINDEIRLFIPKQDATITNQQAIMPDFKNVKVITNRKIDKDTKNIIEKLSKEIDYIEFLFKDNVLKGIHIPDTAIYIFEEYINDKVKIDETNADLILRSTSFLPIIAEEYNVNIAQFQDESKTYCLYTICKNFIDVNVYEELEETTSGSFF